MNTRHILTLATALILGACGRSTHIPLAEGVSLWGGRVKDGSLMPYAAGFYADLSDNRSNQVAPLLLTSDGRYVWSDEPFSFHVTDKAVIIDGKVMTVKAGESLRDAFCAAAARHFPANGKMPPEEFFRYPQYNTWIELMYDQSQEAILDYARGILDNGLPPGIIMIDDTWQEDYGKWDFHPGRFPDPKAMCDELHGMGFKIMLWVCPFVSMDQYLICREISNLDGFLTQGDSGEPVPVRWWNGTSAVLDFSKAGAAKWFNESLQALIEQYGVDGFKFDGGDFEYYPGTNGWEQSSLFVELATAYPYNELRACWRNAGKPVVQRLHDKAHNWDDLCKLIPEMLTASLMGYSFCCPDMVGGGSFQTFLDGDTDEELIVRSAQVHALMPMMQFSLAPWRVLGKRNYEAVLKAVALRESMMDVFQKLYLRAALTGEPIVAPLEYVFPHQGFSGTTDQFMLGDNILVAPVLSADYSRRVSLPEGLWQADDGTIYDNRPGSGSAASRIEIKVPIDRLPYFVKL